MDHKDQSQNPRLFINNSSLLQSTLVNYNPEVISEREIQDITDFASAKQFLFQRLVDTKKRLFGGQLGIARTKAWLGTLDNPQEQHPAVHIAGTSGKGSTSYMTSSILSAMNQKVGTITSPHVYDVRERLLVNQHYISAEEFTHRTQDLIKPIAHLEQSEYGRPTYFEVMIGMAHKCFAEHNVNYAVVETGIGGRFDSTNTIKRSDKLAVITRLGIDHTEILGKTIEEIAWQKAGIIPNNGHVIALLPKDIVAQKVIEQVVKDRGSTLEFVNPNTVLHNIRQTTNGITFSYQSNYLTINNITIPTLGVYQAENACLAIAITEYLSKRDGIDINANRVKQGLEVVSIPARSEITDFHGTPVIIDSAHNPQKLKAFFELIESLQLPKKPLVVFGAKESKDWQTSLPILNSVADKIFVAGFFSNQPGHLQKYSANPDNITRKIKSLGGSAEAFTNPIEALSSALNNAKSGQLIIITGSMYMLGELHDYLKKLT